MRLLEASRTLGAGELATFLRIGIPAARGALGAGAALATARALGEFGATLLFAGSLRGVTQTAPLAIYERFGTDFTGALALSAALIALSRGDPCRDAPGDGARRCSALSFGAAARPRARPHARRRAGAAWRSPVRRAPERRPRCGMLAGLMRPSPARSRAASALVRRAHGRRRRPGTAPLRMLVPGLRAVPAHERLAQRRLRDARRRRARAARARDRLSTRFGAGDLADAHPASLSGGERQRVALARALARRPERAAARRAAVRARSAQADRAVSELPRSSATAACPSCS